MDIKEVISSGLLELYVLGMANEQETAQVAALAKQYPEIAAEIDAIEGSLEGYAVSQAIAPGNTVKEKIFAQVNQSKAQTAQAFQTGGKVIALPFWKYVAAASIILLIGSAILNLTWYNKYQTATKEKINTEKQKLNVEQQLLAQERVNDELKANMSVVQSKYSEPVALRGLPAAPDAAAKIFWMKNTGEVYIDPSNLPDAPPGMQYQLWGIVDGKPVDGGMIITTKKDDKYRIQKMKSFGKAEAFAVTLETAGGNPTPKGEMYVMGKM